MSRCNISAGSIGISGLQLLLGRILQADPVLELDTEALGGIKVGWVAAECLGELCDDGIDLG